MGLGTGSEMALWTAVFLSIFILSSGIVLFPYLKAWKMSRDTQRTAELRKAVRLDSRDMFCYGMDTDVGNAFVYGQLRAVDPVSVPELSGEYYHISLVEEEYVEKTRWETKFVYRDGQMETEREEETYYEWETVSTKDITCKRVTFMDVEFPYEKIPLRPTVNAKSTTEGDQRYTWYVVPSVMQGTLYTCLGNHTISDRSRFFVGLSTEEALDCCLLKKSPPKWVRVYIAVIAVLCVIWFLALIAVLLF